MDKSDVEMDDAKMVQDVDNTAVELETKRTEDSSLKPQGPAVDGTRSSESLVERQDSAKTETEDQNDHSENGAKSPMPAETGNREQETVNNMVEGKNNVADKAVDQTDSRGAVEDSSDAKQPASEVENQSDTISQLDTQGNNVGDDQNRSGIESLDQDNATGEIEGENKIEKKEGDLNADVAGNMQLHDKLPNIMVDEQEEVQQNTETVIADGDTMLVESPETNDDVNNTASVEMPDPATPNLPVKTATSKAEQHSDEAKMADDEDDYEDWHDDGSPDAQAAFMGELESFYKERAMEFKPPKFYGHPLNCLKLWRSVIRLGGYDRVTGSKLWRQVGESFNPPKTCTTVSWTFRIFYEKALLEYERHKTHSGEVRLPTAALLDAGVENEGNGYQAPGSGRARRDAAARAMQGWHEQRLLGNGEVGEPIVKDKSANSMPKREKNLKSIGSLKHKRPNEMEQPAKVARPDTFKQLVTTVVDIGPPADWVKINVRETKDCFEIYALVPGLLREEVRVQSDPAGRLVITGQPEQLDNPWGITAFKKVVSLPARIDPLQTTAVVSLHGRLYVRVPFAQ